MLYRAVMFDVDGTLLDTLKDIADSTNAGLLCLGLPVHKVEEYKYFISDGREALAIRALPEDRRDENTVNRLLDLINAEYTRRWADTTRPYEGIPELLDALVVKQIRMTVLSNKAHGVTELMISKFLDRWIFDVIQGAAPGFLKKPDPTGALQIAGRLAILPSEFLYVGDSGVDMKTAVSAGMYPVGALWGFRSAEELISCGAKTLIRHPGELLNMLA
jgi:phosphoglycolate phosphatase